MSWMAVIRVVTARLCPIVACIPVLQESLSASAFYVRAEDRLPTIGDTNVEYKRMSARMASGGVMTPGSPPPDLPSLLLDQRIVYIGMPVRQRSHGLD